MNNYKFLLKPLFFIFNLIFATWLVFQIEEISPSDFGKYRSLFEDPHRLSPEKLSKKQAIKRICLDFKAGLLDSAQVEKNLEDCLANWAETPNK